MTEENEGQMDIIDQIIQGALHQSKGDVNKAINILRNNLQRKLDSGDGDTREYASWYYQALAELRGDDE